MILPGTDTTARTPPRSTFAVSTTFHGAIPELSINLSICEIGAPCTSSEQCRIHQLRAFLLSLGMIQKISEPRRP